MRPKTFNLFLRRLCLLLCLLLPGCGADTLFEDDDADAVYIDIVNQGDTRITFVSLSFIFLFNPPDTANDLQTEALNPGETVRFERNCSIATTYYLHVRWENGGQRNYRLNTRCGTISTYALPQ
jgi:hypothetical protein